MLARRYHANETLASDVNEQIECAQTLASRFYTDHGVLDIEKARIFRHTWQLAGTLSQSCGEANGLKRENGVHHFHMLLGEFLGQV